MGLLLYRTHLRGENNSPQSAFYTDRSTIQAIPATQRNMMGKNRKI